jgi:hypothetical protein
MLPSLSCLSLTTLVDASQPPAKRAKGTEVIVTETTHRIGPEEGTIKLNVGCVSAAEMIVAKGVLDAFLATTQGGHGSSSSTELLHEHLKRTFIRAGLSWVRYTLRLFKDAINQEVIGGRTTTDIEGWLQLMTLLDHNNDELDEDKAQEYLQFLMRYVRDRQISEPQLLSMIEKEEESSDSDSEQDVSKQQPFGAVYTVGINGVLTEYFGHNPVYAWSETFTRTLRAYRENSNGTLVCVGIMMMTDKTDHPETSWVTSRFAGQSTVRIQGIVSCAIYKHFYNVAIGTPFLKYAQSIAETSGSRILVSPVGNESWYQKLKRADNVTIVNL